MNGEQNTGKNIKRRRKTETRDKIGCTANKPTSDSFSNRDNVTFEKNVNDPAWYNKYPNLVADSANISYASQLGLVAKDATDYNLGASSTITYYIGKSLAKRAALPGYLILEVETVPGYANSVTDPINVAANQIYANVRYRNSGHANYEAPDLMMYLLAMDEAFIYLANMRRIYGMLRAYDPNNRYAPKYWLQSMGYDYDDLVVNMANLRTFINLYAAKLIQRYVPEGIAMFERHRNVFEGVYKDSPDPKSQNYIFMPVGYRVWDDANGTLTPKEFTRDSNSHLITYKTIVDDGNRIIEAIVGSEDFGIMSGDLMKAYKNNYYVPLGVTDDYLTLPVYSDEVCSQIENANVLDGVPTPITQHRAADPSEYSYITCVPKFTLMGASRWLLNIEQIMNMHVPVPKPLDNMVASRFKLVVDNSNFDPQGATPSAASIAGCGSEIVRRGTYYTFVYTKDNPTNLSLEKTEFLAYRNETPEVPSSMSANWAAISNFSAFHHAPRVLIGQFGDSARTMAFLAYDSMQYDTYALVAPETIANMHNVALQSLWMIPETTM